MPSLVSARRLLIAAALVSGPTAAGAQVAGCPVSHEAPADALQESVAPTGGPKNGGLENNEWAAIVDRNGVVCAVTFSGETVHDQWLGRRGIAAEKAFAASGLSLDGFALSTPNLFAGSLPGAFLHGLPATNPVSTAVLHAGDPAAFGSVSDPMVGDVLGGVAAFGGGLPLNDEGGLIGALGVSGDTSCADHNLAWRVRERLGFDAVPAGVTRERTDGIIFDMRPDDTSDSGYGHPLCVGSEAKIAVDIGAGFIPAWKAPAQSSAE